MNKRSKTPARNNGELIDYQYSLNFLSPPPPRISPFSRRAIFHARLAITGAKWGFTRTLGDLLCDSAVSQQLTEHVDKSVRVDSEWRGMLRERTQLWNHSSVDELLFILVGLQSARPSTEMIVCEKASPILKER